MCDVLEKNEKNVTKKKKAKWKKAVVPMGAGFRKFEVGLWGRIVVR